MKRKFLLYLALTTLLFGGPLSCMDVSTDEETQSDSDLGIDAQSDSHWLIGSFVSSQVAGARELLQYGRHAAEDLINMSSGYRGSTETEVLRPPLQLKAQNLLHPSETTHEAAAALINFSRAHGASTEVPTAMDHPLQQLKDTRQLLELFLSNEDAYQEQMHCFPLDMKRLLTRMLIAQLPLVNIMQEKLIRHCCTHTLNHGSKCSLKFNRTGTKILTASSDGKIKVWDASSGSCLLSLGGYPHYYQGAEFNPAGDRIVTPSDPLGDTSARVWNATTGECIVILEGHRNKVNSAQFSTNGDTIATASDDGTAKIWDSATGKCRQTLQSFPLFYILFAQFNVAGDSVLTNSDGGCAKIWDTESGNCLLELRCDSPIEEAQFNTAGDRILTLSFDGCVMIWDATSGVCIDTLPVARLVVAELNAAGNRIVTLDRNGRVELWDALSGAYLHTLEGSFEGSTHRATRDIIATLIGDHTVKIWDTFSGACLHTLQGDSLSCAECNTTGDKLVTTSRSNEVKIWDLRSLVDAQKWLARDCTVEQALLLHCIHEARMIGTWLKEKHMMGNDLRFDFNAFPHLQRHFETMPPLVQKYLAPFVKLKIVDVISEQDRLNSN